MAPLRLVLIYMLFSASPATADNFGTRLAEAALERTSHQVRYDGRYQGIAYPGGDIPDGQGVCTDVVIRAYRQLGIDLQVQIHEDMATNFDAYPPLWGLTRTDRNIDHRRVPNQQAFFARRGAKVIPIAGNPVFQAGDVLTWMLPGNLPHTGIVVTTASDTRSARIVHNIGAGPQLTDISPHWILTGQYRYPGN